MRTSLSEISQIENYLLERGDIEERLVLEARLLANPEMKDRAHWQMTVYELVHLYGREKLLEEIKEVEHLLFQTPKYRSFQDRIRSIFKR